VCELLLVDLEGDAKSHRIGVGHDVGERLADRKERRLVEHHPPAGRADGERTAKDDPAPAVQRVVLHVRAVREVPHAAAPACSGVRGWRATGAW
jgi:hypothetical protein